MPNARQTAAAAESGAARAHGAMLLYAFLISTSFPVGAAITHDLDPVVLTFFRFLFGAAAFAVALLLTRQWQRPSFGLLWRGAATGLPMVIFFVAMFEALRWAEPLNTSALFTLIPLMAAGIGFVLNGHRSGPAQLVCLAIAGMGAVWILFAGDVSRLLAFSLGHGEQIFFLGCVAFAAHSPLISRLHGGYPAKQLTFWSIVTGALVLGLVAAPQLAAATWTEAGAGAWLGVLYLAVANTAVTFFLIQFASRVLPSHKVMAYTYLSPGFVALLQGVLGQGWPAAGIWAAIAVTASVTLLLQRLGRAQS